MRSRTISLLLLTLAGCREAREHRDAAAALVSECEPRTSEKLGVPFVHVCAADLAVAGARFEPFWISAIPLGCSKGEHETVPCPDVLALEQPAAGESREPAPIAPRMATMVDSYIAHRICTMRFAGRLPTRAERARAADAMGLATVMVVASGDPPTSFAFRPLAEWVTEIACDTPSELEPRCRPGAFPSSATSDVPWDALAACDAKPVLGDAARAIALGGSCPLARWDWSSAALPCSIQSVVGPSARAKVSAFSVACRKPAPNSRHPDGGAAVAAFRCVLP